jgi:hypothetical protein
MQRAVYAIQSADDDLFNQRFQEYIDVLSEWNEKFNSFSVQLTLLTSWDMFKELEDVQKIFVRAGSRLEYLVRKRRSQEDIDRSALADLENYLAKNVSRRLFVFNRDVLRVVEYQRARTYYGTKINLSRSNLSQFGSWQLLKALFKPGIKPLTIVRPTSDLTPPLVARE